MIDLPPLIAHRGAPPYAPENTIAAFDKARELGACAVEFDVMMCADGGLFVFHDETFERTSNGVGAFSDASSEYITALDAGAWFSERFCGEKIPAFTDALLWCAEHHIQANIEIKPLPGRVEATTTAVLACLNRYWPVEMPLPLVPCFNREVLRLCARLLPELPLGVLLDRWEAHWREAAEEVKAVSIHLNQYLLTRQRIKAMKQVGYTVCAYTVNSKKMASLYLRWGADSILTDYPDLMDQ